MITMLTDRHPLDTSKFKLLGPNPYEVGTPSFLLEYPGWEGKSHAKYVESIMRDIRNINGRNFVKEAHDDLAPKYPRIYSRDTRPTYEEFQAEVIRTARLNYLLHMASNPPPHCVGKILLCYQYDKQDAWSYCCSDQMNLNFEHKRVDFFRIYWADRDRP